MSTLITNLATNPSFEFNTVGWSSTGGTAIATGDSRMLGQVGNGLLRLTASGTSPCYVQVGGFDGIPVAPGKFVGVRGWVAVDTAVNTVDIQFNVRGTTVEYPKSTATNALFYGGSVVSLVWQTDADTTGVAAQFRLQGPGGAAPAAGTRMWLDAVMFVVGDTQAEVENALVEYKDGNTPGWVWNGTAHASTSTGPSAPYVHTASLSKGGTWLDYLDIVADFEEEAESASTVRTSLNATGVRHHVSVRPSGALKGRLTFNFTRELNSGEPGARAEAVAASLRTGVPHTITYNVDVSGLSSFTFVPTGTVTRRLEVETAHRKRQAIWTVEVDYTRLEG